jgi:tetratricopeptide (TPR) repeat protein
MALDQIAEGIAMPLGRGTRFLIVVMVFTAGGELRAQAAPSAADHPIVAQARALHDSGEREASDRAVVMLEEALRTAPDDTLALFALGDIHIERGISYTLGPPEFAAAAEIAHQLIPLDPARGHELLGRSYMWRGEHSFALEAFEEGITRAPDDAALRAHLAWHHFNLGEHHLAIPAAEAAIGIDSTATIALNVYGFSMFHIDRPDLARGAFERSIAVDGALQGSGALHLVMLAEGNDDAAIAFVESVLAQRPDNPHAYAFVGHAHHFAGNDAEAIRYFEAARHRHPDAGVGYTGRAASLLLASLYIQHGRQEDAEPLIAHALSRADRRLYFGFEPWNSYYQYASIALMQGDREGALRWLQTALVGGMPGPVLIERDPVFADLRGDPGFQEIVERLRARRDAIHQRLDLGSER